MARFDRLPGGELPAILKYTVCPELRQAKGMMKERFIVFLMQGTRPLRILIFGGIFLAWLVMVLLAWLLGIETDIGGDIVISNIVLIIVSLLIGFGVAFRIFRLLENAKYERDPPKNS